MFYKEAAFNGNASFLKQCIQWITFPFFRLTRTPSMFWPEDRYRRQKAETTKIMMARNAPKLPLWFKIILGILVLAMIFQPQFSVHYEYIPQDEIAKSLLEKSIHLSKDTNLPICEHDVIINGKPMEMPNMDVPVQFEKEDIESGQYCPKHCKPSYSTAILVPHRNRTEQLAIFLPYIHKFLRRQEIHYRIFVIHQGDSGAWNKGKLLNAGARVAMELGFPCLVLHDVDLLPLHERNVFACTANPRHMSASLDKFRYNLPYDFLVGGALSITAEQYKAINGYSNKFEMWGGEDDELSNRIKDENLKIERFSPDISRYTMMRHKQEPINKRRFSLVTENYGKYKEDGLSSLKYKRMTILHHQLYTNITVEL